MTLKLKRKQNKILIKIPYLTGSDMKHVRIKRNKPSRKS